MIIIIIGMGIIIELEEKWIKWGIIIGIWSMYGSIKRKIIYILGIWSII